MFHIRERVRKRSGQSYYPVGKPGGKAGGGGRAGEIRFEITGP